MISPDLFTKAGTKSTTQEENVELDKFGASNADPRRYAAFIKKLGNDQYPTTSSAVYELMCRKSGRYEYRSQTIMAEITAGTVAECNFSKEVTTQTPTMMVKA